VTLVEALAFVGTNGVVLESGTGPAAHPIPSIANAVAGHPIRGSWWAHARGREIFAITRALRDCPDILVCRLVQGRITYVHRRLWPAVVRLAERFPEANLAQLEEIHTASGKHAIKETKFPDWVSRDISLQACELDEASALDQLGPWVHDIDA